MVSTARSRALLRWDGSGRPWAFANRVAVRARSRAFAFMRSTNAASSPERRSASAVAASLADAIATPSSRTRSGTHAPARRPMRYFGVSAA